MSSKGSGGKLEGFFTGKGFYIVLFLCAAVIGVSAWMMAAGKRTMAEDLGDMNQSRLENKRVETVIVTPKTEQTEAADGLDEPMEVQAPPVESQGLAETETTVTEESSQVWSEDAAPAAASVYVWPISGELEREYHMERLSYDQTMGDWRTHEGIDILAPLGTEVAAAHAGTVESVVKDDLYGMTVTIDHGDGTRSLYSNLAETVSVDPGDWVEPGAVIGTVGDTALCEVSQAEHLHFAIRTEGGFANPMDYLPA